jgi:hypothetical protein
VYDAVGGELAGSIFHSRIFHQKPDPRIRRQRGLMVGSPFEAMS